VALVAVDADGRVALVRQYRYPVDERLWELPAGRLDAGETPEEAGRRELEEEIGRRPEGLERLCRFYTTPGFCDEAMHLFRASGLVVVPARPEDDERIEVGWFELAEALAMIDRGEIREAKTIIGLLLEARRYRPREG
jgi:ADP-ribose diphosphatase